MYNACSPNTSKYYGAGFRHGSTFEEKTVVHYFYFLDVRLLARLSWLRSNDNKGRIYLSASSGYHQRQQIKTTWKEIVGFVDALVAVLEQSVLATASNLGMTESVGVLQLEDCKIFGFTC